MELLSTLNEIGIANTIKEELILHNIKSKNDSSLKNVKTQLRNECNIVYFNIVSTSSLGLKIMAKTLMHTYFYEYRFNTREISLVGGIRKNVVTN